MRFTTSSSLTPVSEGDGSANELLAARRAKLERLRSEGVEPFPHEFDGVEAIASVLDRHAELAAGASTDVAHRVAGRLTARREAGKLAFLDLVDRSGRIQLMARENDLGEEGFARLVGLDLGDLIGVDGVGIRTRTGELSLRVTDFTLLAKSLRPPPDHYHGLSDVETRFRRRELDLIANEDTRALFLARARIVSARAARARRRRLRRARDAGPAAALRRRGRAPVHDPPQRARPHALPADRDRALPQARDRRRARARLRARQGLPQRGPLAQAQPRVHDARVV